MLMTELIEKKRAGGELSREEISLFISGYCAGEIPDYQVSALLMAISFVGMTDAETLALTDAMLRSGEALDLSAVSGIKADKHSTGGVGDKTSLVLCPMLAALGVKMAKMSGRGLGFTGGTLDKLESIPGFRCALSREKFFSNVDKIGFAIAAQTEGLDPADKKLYALRDVTGTVAVRPLIVSSIMSKKLAAGADYIVLDVKTGSGSFCKTEEDAFALARDMVRIGTLAGKRITAVITGMDEPLGNAVGNALEVAEAISALRGEKHGNLMELCLGLGERVLLMAGLAENESAARSMLEDSVRSGKALCKLSEFIAAQGGNARVTEDLTLLPSAPEQAELRAKIKGYVNSIQADAVGTICMRLGGGRQKKTDSIDHAVGVVLDKKAGDAVQAGETLAHVHARDGESAAAALCELERCYEITPDRPALPPFIRGVVS